jgi:hypothetical protein
VRTMVFTEIDRNSLVKIGGGRCCAHKLRGYDGVAFSFETGENIDIKFNFNYPIIGNCLVDYMLKGLKYKILNYDC